MKEKKYLNEALRNNETERSHIEHCVMLARSLEWLPIRTRAAGPEFSKMLNSEGLEIFESILKRIYEAVKKEKDPEIQNPSIFVEQIMFVHDLGKYKIENGHAQYNGEDHEIRSAEIIRNKKNKIGWHYNNFKLLHDLVLHHGLFGVIRTGEASLAFLLPILKTIRNLESNRKRLFLDFLIVVTCCDAGATIDSRTKKRYLDDSRVKLYQLISDNLFNASNQADDFAALFRIACDFSQTVDRIDRIVTSGNRNLVASKKSIRRVLVKVKMKQHFDLNRFARTRFDHGFYVFEPLLWNLSNKQFSDEAKIVEVSKEVLENFLILLNIISKDNRLATHQIDENLSVIGLRNIFSIKDEFYEKHNGENFKLLCNAVRMGNQEEIIKVIDIAIQKIKK